jgi:hypothetical protein
MLSDKHAGAEVDRPLPPREGVGFDAQHPLHSFIRRRPQALKALAECQAASFWWSLPNLAPKLALDKVAFVEETPTEIVFGTADGSLRILPLADRATYWRTIMRYVEAKATLALIPEWAADALRRHYKVAPQQKEYMIATETLRALPGGSLRNVRNLINKARRATTMGRFEGDYIEDYLNVNRAWYKQNAEAKFRTYDKTSIDWMLRNWTHLRVYAPDLLCFGIRANDDGKLIAFTIASTLCEGAWSAYTERFDREHPIQGCNWLLWQEIAKSFEEPWENDGTADTTALRRNKGKVVASLAPFFKVSQ